MRELLRSIVFCFLACSVVVVLAAVVLGRQRDLRAANLQVRAWRDIEVTTERVLRALGDAETGQRGYLLTHEADYLRPFEKAMQEVAALTAALEMFSSARPDQLRDAREITALARMKLDELVATVQLAQEGRWDDALGLVRTGHGKSLMDQIGVVGARLGATATEGAQTGRARADRATQQLVISVVTTSALSIILLVILTYSLRRDAKRIRETAEQLRITLRSIGDAVVTTDAQGRVNYLNPVAVALGGRELPSTPVPFEQLFHLVSEATGDTAENPIAKVLKDGKTIGLANHTALRRPDGTMITIEDSAAPLCDENKEVRGVVFVFKDITERRAAERELEAARQQLERNLAELRASGQALRAADRHKDEFLATLAHELRNPLAPIRHAVALLDKDELSAEQRRWAHAVIGRQAAHMSRLLDDLLDSARISRGELVLKRAPVSLQSIIDDALAVARPIMERKQHVVQRVLPAQSVTLLVDGIRIAQALSNLLTNAAKYTDPGGSIVLKAELDREQLSIAVSDSGIGIAPEAVPSVFAMFGQVQSAKDRSEGGLGIGLSLANELLKLHGGRIEVHSAGENRGSTFALVLPAHVVQEEGAAAAPASSAFARHGSARLILVIDDNADAAASLGMLLSNAGDRVLTALTGEEGLQLAREHRPSVVIIDIGLPGIDGYQVAQTLRAADWTAGLVLIALTGWGQLADKNRAIAAGFDYHVTKPADPEAIQRILSGI